MSVIDHDAFESAKKSPEQPDWASPYEFARAILLTAQEKTDHRASYSELWEHLHGEPPHYRSFFRKFSTPFADLGRTSIVLKLPYINALIVSKRTRQPSRAAVDNMAEFIKVHGIATGRNAREYLDEQAKLAEKLTLKDLDRAFVAFRA